MAVGLLLVVFLVQLFNATLKAWQNGENQNDTYRQARAALQLMVRDLSETTAPLLSTPTPSPSPLPSPLPSPAAAYNTAPVFVLDRYPAPEPPQQAGDEINEEAYCLTMVPNNGASSLCAVGYFCVWMPDLIADSDPQASDKRARAPHAFALMRQFLGSGRPAGSVPTPPATPPPTSLPVYGLFDRFKAAQGKKVLTFTDVYERVAPPLLPDPLGPPPPLSAATELCSYVWDLQFRTSDNLQSLPGAVISAYPTTPNMPTVPPSYPATLPAYVEIRFKALSAAAARQLEGNTAITRQTWGNPSDPFYQKVIQPGTRQFSVRVPIHGGTLTTATPSPTP